MNFEACIILTHDLMQPANSCGNSYNKFNPYSDQSVNSIHYFGVYSFIFKYFLNDFTLFTPQQQGFKNLFLLAACFIYTQIVR